MFVVFLASVSCWGAVGHQETGAIADLFLSNSARLAMRNLLPLTYFGKLEYATSWADKIKRTKGYGWTSKLHYVKAKMNEKCSIEMDRDCLNDNCSIGAINNFTFILANSADKLEALLFFIHFIGDLHNPLHNCDKLGGGNGQKVLFGHKHTNLHSVWDGLILEKWIKQQYKGNYSIMVESIQQYMEIGIWKDEKQTWIKCTDPIQVVCPLDWAIKVAQYNCKSIWKGLDVDLSKEYFDIHAPILEKLVAMAGYRMANILNNIFSRFDLELK
jgi:hypothetical protein